MSERPPAIDFAINVERSLTFTWPTGKSGETNGRAWTMWSVLDENKNQTVMFPTEALVERIDPLVIGATREAPVTLSIKKVQTTGSNLVTWAVEPVAGGVTPAPSAIEGAIISNTTPASSDTPQGGIAPTTTNTDAEWLGMAQQLASARQMADIAAQLAQLDATPETWAATLFIEAQKRGLPPLTHLDPTVDEPSSEEGELAPQDHSQDDDELPLEPMPITRQEYAPGPGDSDDLPF